MHHGKYIDVTVLTPDGRRHYTSGKYRIAEIKDSISEAGYTSTLKLIKNVESGFKNAFKDAVQKAMVVTQSEIVDYTKTSSRNAGILETLNPERTDSPWGIKKPSMREDFLNWMNAANASNGALGGGAGGR